VLVANKIGEESGASSVDRGKDVFGHKLALRHKRLRLRVIAACKRNYEVQIGDSHQDRTELLLPTVRRDQERAAVRSQRARRAAAWQSLQELRGLFLS
jgi:hypothetical protein